LAGDGTRFPGVHDALAEEVVELEGVARDFGACIESALRVHGRQVVERQLVQERLAEAAINLYVGFACVSRIDGALRARGETASAGELAVARKAIRDALYRT